ncbi:TM2 domain-containing protein [Desmospora profundinema]|uniref:TM2 domain-containing membrane protein YozV n=1 Tax=Desmospora profundinema TaxID=1571184 RepID=A0ABU1IMK0_9BACL|nr:TM2 domain-containing protein [Desmospora profundinema]MDR6225772.1 TM2 domain-containing membrane protein YozV [Desmospora profundinema]
MSDNVDLKSQLDSKSLSIAQTELENQKKTNLVAYLLWFFVGYFGAHRFYVGRTGSGITMLLLFLFGAILSVFLIGIPMMIAVGIWVIVDAFLLYRYVQEENIKKEREILTALAARQQQTAQ